MDENDIFNMTNGDNDSNNRKTPFEKKYLIAITIVSVVLVIAMTLVGIFIGYNSAAKTSHSIVEKNPNITIEGTTNMAVGVQDVTRMVENSVVQVTSEIMTTTGAAISRGSGVIVTKDGYIITNAHVVEGASGPSSIKVALANGKEYTARKCRMDTAMDIAYIKIETSEELSNAVLGNSDELQKGERVVIIGNPLGTLGGSVTDGVLSALDREIIVENRPMHLLQTNAEINPGNSGGGMFNMNGELIGIVNAKSTSTEIEGIGFAIPINMAYDVFKDLVEFGYVKGRVDAGIQPVGITSFFELLRIFGTTEGEYPAVYVYNVDKRLSDKVKVGDKIVAINDKAISSLAEYNTLIGTFKIGDKVKYTLKRSGNIFDVDIILQEYKG